MARNPKQDANLKRGGLTPEEARKRGAKGGKASGEARRARRDMRQMLEAVMTAPNKDPKLAKQMVENGFEGDDNVHAAGIVFQLITKAQKGDLQAMKMLFETLYGKQDQNVNVNMSESKVTFYLPEKDPEDD